MFIYGKEEKYIRTDDLQKDVINNQTINKSENNQDSETILQCKHKLMPFESVMPSNYLTVCQPLLFLQSFPASGSFPMSQFLTSGDQSIGVSASASVLSTNISGLISFRMDWLDLLAVQGTLQSLLQHHSSKASILRCSAFFIVQL